MTESASRTCADRFPQYDIAAATRMPAYCRAHANEVNEGSPVSDLNTQYETLKQRGLWKTTSHIFRGSVRRDPDTARLDALQMLTTDIAGHSLGFAVDATGQMVLHCVNLIGRATESCRVSNQHWMHQIEDK